jgi:4-hydroxy 2-oxovalerate aldolase|tara:strand:- start:336 stop:1316 length:981 start_codon:yes stop_codon:yes gene_type:complete
MNNINILDCTLRDGGYYNNWNFSKKFINEYLYSIKSAKINYVELGFSQIKKNKNNGICYNVDNSLINNLKIPNGLNIGIMINAKDILIKDNSPDKFRKYIFNKNISLIRIACHFNEINNVLPYLKKLRSNKYKLAINLMQISEQSDQKISNIIKKLSNEKIDIIYFADSLGCMVKKNINKVIKIIKSNCNFKIGFHAHDNLGKAKSNVEYSIINGVDWIDTTVLGMGRGAGNAKTEDFVNKVNKPIITALIKKNFLKLNKKYKWGHNKFYNLSAKHKIHPSYIQEISQNINFNEKKFLKAINLLKKKKSNNFSFKNLNKIVKAVTL